MISVVIIDYNSIKRTFQYIKDFRENVGFNQDFHFIVVDNYQDGNETLDTINQEAKSIQSLDDSIQKIEFEKQITKLDIQIGKLNTEILKLNNEALYDRHFFGLFGLTSAEKRSAQRIRETLAGFENLNDFSWDKIKEHAQSDMKQEAIKGFFDAKKQLYESGQEIVKQMENVQGYADGEDFGFGEAFSQKSQWGL